MRAALSYIDCVKRITTGWRLARDSWAVLRADRSLAIYPLLSTVFAALAIALLVAPGLIGAAAADEDWIVLPFLLVAGYAATFFVVYFNVALAGAARLSMDGRDTTVADGLAVARERRGLIAKWALIQFAVGLAIKALERVGGDSAGALVSSVVSGLMSVAWSVSTFFVIPLLALEGLSPGDAMKRSVSLIRERWGEGLVGTASIGLAVFLVALLPLAVFLQVSLELIDAVPVLGAIAGVLWLLALTATLAVGSALGVIFRVQLYRYSTQGQPAGGFTEADVAGAFAPGRRAASAPA